MQIAVDSTTDLELAQNIYNCSLKVEAQNDTFKYIMATQEVAATSTTKPPTKDMKDDIVLDDLDTTTPKNNHNNLEEAAEFLKRVNTITDTFVDNLSGFNRHTLQGNYMNFMHELHRALIKLDSTYFGDANPKLVLKLVDDKLCKAYCNRSKEDEATPIEVRTAPDTIPQGHDALSRMAQQKQFKALDDKKQAAIIKLFSHLQLVHDNMALVTGQIAMLGEILELEQFAFLMQMAIRPLVQLKIPGHLCSPADVSFEKECVTTAESFEEECSNKVLPKPFSPKLDKIPPKHPIRCEATVVHMILHRKLFNTKLSQVTITGYFTVHLKKLHMMVSRRKYNPGKKHPKCKMDTTTPASTKKHKSTTVTAEGELSTQSSQPMESTQTTQSSQPMQSSQPDYKLDDFDTDAELPDPFSSLQEGDKSEQAEASSKQFTTKKPPPQPCCK